MKTILTFGVYDMLHIGHILLFKHAKELFPGEECRLIVAVQDGDFILKYKPEAYKYFLTVIPDKFKFWERSKNKHVL